MSVQFTFSYEGNDADGHQLDFYDVAQALMGFQRSLALTTHLILNGEIITQAPSLKNATIYASPPEEGSWKFIATVIPTIIALGTASQDSFFGHMIYSAYDYVVSETMGFHINYDESLGQQYERMKEDENNKLPILEQSQFDSVIEKTEYNIQEMHRPIVKSETAQSARIFYNRRGENIPFHAPLTYQSYDYIRLTEQSNAPVIVQGKVSSYNINTYKGRIFIPDERRPIPFELSNEARNSQGIVKILNNMTSNAQDRFGIGGNSGLISFTVLKNTSRSGRLKSYHVLEVY